jgi:hypothetical protein
MLHYDPSLCFLQKPRIEILPFLYHNAGTNTKVMEDLNLMFGRLPQEDIATASLLTNNGKPRPVGKQNELICAGNPLAPRPMFQLTEHGREEYQEVVRAVGDRLACECPATYN